MNLDELLKLMQLINGLAPTGISLVKTLATNLVGKTDAELKSIGDALDDAIIAKADQEISNLPPQA